MTLTSATAKRPHRIAPHRSASVGRQRTLLIRAVFRPAASSITAMPPTTDASARTLASPRLRVFLTRSSENLAKAMISAGYLTSLFNPWGFQCRMHADVAGSFCSKFVDNHLGNQGGSITNNCLEYAEQVLPREDSRRSGVEYQVSLSGAMGQETKVQIACSGSSGKGGNSPSSQVSNIRSVARAGDTVSSLYSRNTACSYARARVGL